MRLQLVVVGSTLLWSAGLAAAQSTDSSASAGVGIYADTDHMVVVSPRAGALQRVSEQVSLDVSMVADVISGASVDVVSEASPTAIRETRIEGALGTTLRWTRELTSRVRGRVSHEEDYLSLGAEIGAAIELRQRTTTVDVGLSVGSDRVEAVTRPDFSERRSELRAVATITQVMDRRTYVDAILETHRRAGYLASPYRTVPVVDPASPSVMRLSEVVPDERLAVAGALVVRRAVASRLFARVGYRYYRDDWGVSSHTMRAIGLFDRNPWRGGIEARVYIQGGADFYREHYELEDGAMPELRTRDRRLGAMVSATAALTVERALGPEWSAIASLSSTRFAWLEFASQRRRDALMSTIGVSRSF